MRIPASPPSIDELLTPEQLTKLILDHRDAIDGADDGEYLHWDKLRRKPVPPPAVSSEAWWVMLKLKRLMQRQTLPLRGVRDRPFHVTPTVSLQERLRRLDMQAAGQLRMPAPITDEATREEYIVSSLREEAITSSQLEGASTTRRVAREMLRTGRRPVDRSERMILNNYRTMELIREIRDEALTPELVFEIHQLVTDGTLDVSDGAGRFRRADEAIAVVDAYDEVLHDPPPAEQLEERMVAMCAFANGQTPDWFVHPALRAIALHFWLAYDHPFVDGNGRVARALFYWKMLREGFWLFEFVSISNIILRQPVQYGRAFLYTETDENDLTYFARYHLDVIEEAIASLHAYLKRKAEQRSTIDALMRDHGDLNHRQKALLGEALKDPTRFATYVSHQRTHGISPVTARRDLLGLEELGLLERGKAGRKITFRPVKGLGDKLLALGQSR